MIVKFKFRFTSSAVTLSYLSVFILYINIFSIPPIALILIKEIGINHFQVGLLMTVYNVFYCVSNVFTGILSDKFGPKKIMVVGLFLAFLSSLILTNTPDFNTMLASRVLTGFGAAIHDIPLYYLYLVLASSTKKGIRSEGDGG